MDRYEKRKHIIEVLDLAEKVENAIREVISAGVWKHYRISYEREFDDYYVWIRVRIPLDPQGDC
jgi:preprotein translocase subunit SecA